MRKALASREVENEDQDEGVMPRLNHRMVQMANNFNIYWKGFGPRFRSGVDVLYDDIREDEQFKHSAWVLAAMCTSFVLLFYFGVALSSQISGYLDEMYAPRRDCAVRTIENNGQLGNLIFRLAGFTEATDESGETVSFENDVVMTDIMCPTDVDLDNLTPAALVEAGLSTETLDTAQQSAAGNQSGIPGDITLDVDAVGSDGARLYRCSTSDYSDNNCLALVVINQLENMISEELGETKEPTKVFYDHSIGKTIYVVDRILQHLRWSVWLGLFVGIGVGLLSLLSVLAQYKRLSLAIRSG